MTNRRLKSNVDRMRANNDVVGLLKKLRETDDLRVLGALEDALEDIGHRSIQPFIEALKDKDAYVRSGAAWILGNIKDVNTVDPLIEALKDEDENVRWLVVTALGYIGDERVISHIKMVPTDDDEFLKEMVAEALQKIKDRYTKKYDE